MKLIGSLTSPYVRKTRVVLAEKKIDYDFVIDPPWLAGNSVSRFNPLGKIPVLVLDDDSSLYDSRVIVEYLDSMTPNNKMIPASGRQRITVKRWEALADGICDAAVAAFHEASQPQGQQRADSIAHQRGKIDLALEALTEELGESPWFHGNALSLADVAIGSALGYLSFRLADLDWSSRHPNLGRLYDKLMQRPSFLETAPRDQ